jgi:hypothetical protein
VRSPGAATLRVHAAIEASWGSHAMGVHQSTVWCTHLLWQRPAPAAAQSATAAALSCISLAVLMCPAVVQTQRAAELRPSLVELPGIEPGVLPGQKLSALQFRYISFQFRPACYLPFRLAS